MEIITTITVAAIAITGVGTITVRERIIRMVRAPRITIRRSLQVSPPITRTRAAMRIVMRTVTRIAAITAATVTVTAIRRTIITTIIIAATDRRGVLRKSSSQSLSISKRLSTT